MQYVEYCIPDDSVGVSRCQHCDLVQGISDTSPLSVVMVLLQKLLGCQMSQLFACAGRTRRVLGDA